MCELRKMCELVVPTVENRDQNPFFCIHNHHYHPLPRKLYPQCLVLLLILKSIEMVLSFLLVRIIRSARS